MQRAPMDRQRKTNTFPRWTLRMKPQLNRGDVFDCSPGHGIAAGSLPSIALATEGAFNKRWGWAAGRSGQDPGRMPTCRSEERTEAGRLPPGLGSAEPEDQTQHTFQGGWVASTPKRNR